MEAKGGRQERGSGRQGEKQAAGSYVIWFSSDLPRTFGIPFLFPRVPLFPLFSICIFHFVVFPTGMQGAGTCAVRLSSGLRSTLRIFTRLLRSFRFVSFFDLYDLAF